MAISDQFLFELNPTFHHRTERIFTDDADSSVYILDRIYLNPDAVRARALELPFNCRGPFPGLRTLPVDCLHIRKALEELIDDPITFWPVFYDTGAFQVTCDDDSNKLFVHADSTWIALVYLSPNPPPRSGTSFTGIEPLVR